jgi:hypothetical protein
MLSLLGMITIPSFVERFGQSTLLHINNHILSTANFHQLSLRGNGNMTGNQSGLLLPKA